MYELLVEGSGRHCLAWQEDFAEAENASQWLKNLGRYEMVKADVERAKGLRGSIGLSYPGGGRKRL